MKWKYKLKQLNFDKLPKETDPYGSFKYQMGTSICKKRLTYFRHLNWGIQPFQLYSGKAPSPIEWLLNPGNKGKI